MDSRLYEHGSVLLDLNAVAMVLTESETRTTPGGNVTVIVHRVFLDGTDVEVITLDQPDHPNFLSMLRAWIVSVH